MGGLFRPVGGRAAAVYWRRRLLIALVLAGVGIFVWQLVDPRGLSDAATVTSGTGSVRPNAVKPCLSKELSLSVEGSSPINIGSDAKLTVGVSNNGEKRCSFNPSKTPLVLAIRSGPDGVWSTDNCSAWAIGGAVTIEPKGSHQWEVRWPTKRSQQGCRYSATPLAAGTYIATVTTENVQPSRFVFRLAA